MKDNEKAQLVNELTEIARKYHAQGCLREKISKVVNSKGNSAKALEKKFRIRFRYCGVNYDSAYELGYKCAKGGLLNELGGNPYDPGNTDFDKFTSGVLAYKTEVAK